jgi:hypothetical protein
VRELHATAPDELLELDELELLDDELLDDVLLDDVPLDDELELLELELPLELEVAEVSVLLLLEAELEDAADELLELAEDVLLTELPEELLAEDVLAELLESDAPLEEEDDVAVEPAELEVLAADADAPLEAVEDAEVVIGAGGRNTPNLPSPVIDAEMAWLPAKGNERRLIQSPAPPVAASV